MPDHTDRHEPELLTITEAAELLRAPVATLRYWRHCNTGPRSFRLGRRVLYRLDDLHAWIAVRRDHGGRRDVNARQPTTRERRASQPSCSRTCAAPVARLRRPK